VADGRSILPTRFDALKNCGKRRKPLSDNGLFRFTEQAIRRNRLLARDRVAAVQTGCIASGWPGPHTGVQHPARGDEQMKWLLDLIKWIDGKLGGQG
jgi:hypothetical protein